MNAAKGFFKNYVVYGTVETCDHCNKKVKVLAKDDDNWLLCPTCWPLYHLYPPKTY